MIPYQNAVSERVNGILKHEFINGIIINDKELYGLFIKNSIEIYNNQRPHYSCYMKTPNQMHNQNQINIRTYKKTRMKISPFSFKYCIFIYPKNCNDYLGLVKKNILLLNP